ncbi:TonB-dependent receptor [Flavobacterium sp.]|uniref:TonB-dependent receptor n=1 Tax=Flavobacterium sp. TaxID=239 RepID=UPI0038FBF9C4
MKNKIIIILLITFQFSFAQKKDENIGTEVVNVVKPYTPTISDAFKVKEVPSLNDNETSKKEDVKYQIFSFPVASTFTPSKGKAAGVDKAKQEKLFSNYATFGLGNYGTLNTELFVSHEIDNYQYVGGKIQHQSSQGGIKNVVLDDKFSETLGGIFYGYQRNDIKWTADLGMKNEGYNWYGLPIYVALDENLVMNINPKHSYNTAKVGTELTISNSFFNQLNLNYIAFSDNYNSKENRFIIKPSFTFNFGDTAIKANFGLDYLNSSSDKAYDVMFPDDLNNSKNQKSVFIFNVNPSFQILKDDLSLDLGVNLVYYSRIKDVYSGIESDSGSKFLIYPKVNVSYKVVGDLMIAFGGAEGKLIQNSYANFAQQNKFLSPTLLIKPTDQQYEIFAGLRGKLSSILSYSVKGAYNVSKDSPLFVSNNYSLSNLNKDNYTYGNSFYVVYDNINTLSFNGQLKADVNKNISLGLNAEFNSYKVDKNYEAWNLPTIKASFNSDFNIGKKWYAGTQFFYVEQRKDIQVNTSSLGHSRDYIQTISGFFDINAHVGYKYNERLTAFLKGNNLANQSYNRWLNYPVQGAQVIVGASYKFDF